MSTEYIYRVITPDDWAATLRTGAVPMAPIDIQDGYVHLSPEAEALKTVQLYFSEELAPFLIRISAEKLGARLLWEVIEARGNIAFPHLYDGPIPIDAVDATIDIDWDLNSKPHLGAMKSINARTG